MAKSRRRTQTKRFEQLNNWKQYAIGLFVLVSVITFSALYLLESSAQPFTAAKKHAEEVAQNYAGVTNISQVAIYNGKETYYAVQGQNQSGEAVFVLVPETSSDIFVYRATEGISQADAIQRAQENGAGTASRTVLGYEDGHAVWEVKAGTAYYLIDFKTGELIKKEGV